VGVAGLMLERDISAQLTAYPATKLGGYLLCRRVSSVHPLDNCPVEYHVLVSFRGGGEPADLRAKSATDMESDIGKRAL
jgi:hypothetical protein